MGRTVAVSDIVTRSKTPIRRRADSHKPQVARRPRGGSMDKQISFVDIQLLRGVRRTNADVGGIRIRDIVTVGGPLLPPGNRAANQCHNTYAKQPDYLDSRYVSLCVHHISSH